MIIRCFIGLQARSMSIWSGGVYASVRLTSPDRDERGQAAARAANIWRNILLLEEIVAALAFVGEEETHASLTAFAQTCIWKEQTVYRELHTLLLQGDQEAAEHYAWRLHSGILHEKGQGGNKSPGQSAVKRNDVAGAWAA